MRLRFTKMHGCGNDFIMIDGLSQKVQLSPEQIRKLCDRRFGVGCDQLLIAEAPNSPEVDFRYRIFNQDGSEVENCGNGARAFAKFVRDRRLTAKSRIVVENLKGKMVLSMKDNGDVAVDMGVPVLAPAAIPFIAEQQSPKYSLEIAGRELTIGAVSMGNPHAVIVTARASDAPVLELGSQLQASARFPEGVNVGFMEVISRHEINLRVLERGVGETLACGTGACAAVVAGRLQGLLDQQVKVNLRGGSVLIDWPGEGHPVIKTGPAATVFVGQAFI